MSTDFFWKLDELAHQLESDLPAGVSATAVANDGGKILIYVQSLQGKVMLAELLPNEDRTRLRYIPSKEMAEVGKKCSNVTL